MGKTTLARVATYVSPEVAAKLEEIRRERGLRSISALAGEVLAQAVIAPRPDDDKSGAAFEFAKAVAPVEPNAERVAERAFALAEAFAAVKQRRRQDGAPKSVASDKCAACQGLGDLCPEHAEGG